MVKYWLYAPVAPCANVPPLPPGRMGTASTNRYPEPVHAAMAPALSIPDQPSLLSP